MNSLANSLLFFHIYLHPAAACAASNLIIVSFLAGIPFFARNTEEIAVQFLKSYVKCRKLLIRDAVTHRILQFKTDIGYPVRKLLTRRRQDVAPARLLHRYIARITKRLYLARNERAVYHTRRRYFRCCQTLGVTLKLVEPEYVYALNAKLGDSVHLKLIYTLMDTVDQECKSLKSY